MKSALSRTAIFFFLVSAAAFAQNWQPLLKNTPAQLFTPKDWEIFKAAVYKTLDEKPDGSVSTWKNAETGSSGTLTVVNTSQGATGACRKIKIKNQAGGRENTSLRTLCKQADGQWKLLK